MDVGSIISNALGGIIASLVVLLLVHLGKQIRARAKQRRTQPKEILDAGLRQSQEYKGILQRRRSYRFLGFMALFGFIALLSVPVTILVLYGRIDFHFKSAWDGISAIGMYVSLAFLTPMSLYNGFARITAQEVEAKRRERRERTLREALGARPYGYIGQEIIFPVVFLLFFLVNSVGLVFILLFPPPPIHIPLVVTIPIIGLLVVFGPSTVYSQIKRLYQSIKNIKNVPCMRKIELRSQFYKDEFEQ